MGFRNDDLMVLAMGGVCLSPPVAEAVVVNDRFAMHVCAALIRHSLGDWGVLSQQDRECNNIAMQTGLRVVSAHTIPEGLHEEDVLWVVTEGDRAKTSVLFSKEYRRGE